MHTFAANVCISIALKFRLSRKVNVNDERKGIHMTIHKYLILESNMYVYCFTMVDDQEVLLTLA